MHYSLANVPAFTHSGNLRMYFCKARTFRSLCGQAMVSAEDGWGKNLRTTAAAAPQPPSTHTAASSGEAYLCIEEKVRRLISCSWQCLGRPSWLLQRQSGRWGRSQGLWWSNLTWGGVVLGRHYQVETSANTIWTETSFYQGGGEWEVEGHSGWHISCQRCQQ